LWPDSRVRSSYPLTWTDSGRSSSRQPNLQNIPRRKDIRDLFGVPPGGVLIEADLSQIEFRIMVCLAGDENGIAGYLRGDDAHVMTARGISGNHIPTKEQRTNAKPVNFGFLYGAQAATVQGMVADDYGVIWTDAQSFAFRDVFMRTYPRIPEFHAESRQRLVTNRGWFESVVGHVFYYKEWDARDQGKRDHTFRAALNSEAQGPAAQLMFYIMGLSRRMLDARGFHSVEFVNTVHDSVLIEVPNPAWVPDVIATVREASQVAYEWVRHWFVVPLVLDFKAGESWGSLADVKD
jgi:DNA polymerase I-like protein with 3'-5' exonuclease and polymerase domains